MALFESYESRIAQIKAVLEQVRLRRSVDELQGHTATAKGIDAYEIVKGIQPICFENAMLGLRPWAPPSR